MVLAPANSSDIVVRVRDLTRSWGPTSTPANITCELRGPSVVGLFGENGSGKTTFLRIIAQTVRPTSGAVLINGMDLEHNAVELRRCTAYLPHEPPAYSHLTVRENLEFHARLHGVRLDQILRVLELWEFDERRSAQPVHQLSRGWRQRYGLARLDLHGQAQVLLLDEPTTGLDEHGRALLEAGLERWGKHALAVVATHERAWITAITPLHVDLDAQLDGIARDQTRAEDTVWA